MQTLKKVSSVLTMLGQTLSQSSDPAVGFIVSNQPIGDARRFKCLAVQIADKCAIIAAACQPVFSQITVIAWGAPQEFVSFLFITHQIVLRRGDKATIILLGGFA